MKLSRLAKWAASFAVLAALAYSIRLQWTEVRASLDELTIISSLGAIGLSLAALGAAVMALSEVLVGLGTVLSTRAALCIYAMSQLAKYVPGGIWPVVVQMQVGRVFDVPRHRSAAAFFLTLGASAAVATALGGLLALTGDGMGLLYGFLPLCLVLFHPAVLARARRLSGRAQERVPETFRGAPKVASWLLLHWLLMGAATIVLLNGVGADAPPTRVIGAVGLSWAVGLAVIFVPAGAGVREGLFTVLLSPFIGVGTALTVALLSRLAITAADVILALAGLTVWRTALTEQISSDQELNATG